MVIATGFVIILFTCLKERLQPHASLVVKHQEKLLKKHLLDRKYAEGYHNRRHGQEPAVPTYFDSLDSVELVNPYPQVVSND
mmetsp:Transcript_37522/g.49339  ORF Transcript_37522/g.49339 Transcript_37522/m.49339 type:complete len:82 (+) Transcript_37522:491-736(+)